MKHSSAKDKDRPQPERFSAGRVLGPGSGGEQEGGFLRELSLTDATMIVAGSMIGSGIFIVSADMGRLLGASGWLLLGWIVTGVLTLAGALAYGELSGMMPQAGGQYVFLREAYSPLWGFLFGWTNFFVIKTGSIAAVGAAFAKYLGVLVPAVSPTAWVVKPINLSSGYAISLSSQQLLAILIILFLSYINTRGVRTGKLVQNVFTSVKTLSLVALALIGLAYVVGHAPAASNFTDPWTPRNTITILPDFPILPPVSAESGIIGLLVAFCLAQVGSLFAADAWGDLTFASGEVKNPRRSVPLAMAAGTGLVITLYILANVTYLTALPLEKIQQAPDDRVATAALETIFGGAGAVIMAVAIMISTFGCNNGMILTGARVYYAMARDGLFFKSTGRLNARAVPGAGLVLQGVWSAILVLPRTRLCDAAGNPLIDPTTGLEQYGNMYSALLDYVIFAQLLFYVLTVIGIFILRRRWPDVPRPYRAFGYPIIPALYVLAAASIMVVMLLYKTQTTWPGLALVLTGIPVYALWRSSSRSAGKTLHTPR